MSKILRCSILSISPLFAIFTALWIVAGTSGLPIDDAYIFEKYVLNLRNGIGYCFNPGEVSFGVTSFLWTILNAAILKIIPILSFQTVSHAIGIFCFIFTIVLIEIWIIREIDSIPIAATFSFLCALSPMMYMNSVSGMESMFFGALLLGYVFSYRFYGIIRAFPMGMFAATLFLTRPEGLYAAISVICIEIWFAIRRRNFSRLKNIPFFILGFFLLSAPMIVYTRLHTPGWLPTTYYGKMVAANCGPNLLIVKAVEIIKYIVKGYGRTTAAYGWVGGIALGMAVLWAVEIFSRAIFLRRSAEASNLKNYARFALLIFSAIFAELWRRGNLPVLKIVSALGFIVSFSIIFLSSLRRTNSAETDAEDLETAGNIALIGLLFFPAAYGLFFRAGPLYGGYYNRYIIVLTPIIWLAAARTTGSLLSEKIAKRWIYAAISLSLVYAFSLFAVSFLNHARVYSSEAQLNEGLRMQAARWLRDNTPKDAVVMVGYTGLGVVGGRCERYVVDLGALINPDIIDFYKDAPCFPKKRWPNTVAYMRHRNVSYFVTVPGGRSPNPHADPDEEPGLAFEAEFADTSPGLFFNKIRIWRVE